LAGESKNVNGFIELIQILRCFLHMFQFIDDTNYKAVQRSSVALLDIGESEDIIGFPFYVFSNHF
jgi:hypothetical protein